jgi:hypothetical protein
MLLYSYPPICGQTIAGITVVGSDNPYKPVRPSLEALRGQRTRRVDPKVRQLLWRHVQQRLRAAPATDGG